MGSRLGTPCCRGRNTRSNGQADSPGEPGQQQPGYRPWSPKKDDRRVQVALTTIAGDRLELPPLCTDVVLREVKAAARTEWGLPVAAQRLLLGGQVVEAPDCAAIGDVFLSEILPAAGDKEQGLGLVTAVELTCVRAALPEELQVAVDDELMHACARGDAEAATLALAEGASPNCERRFMTPLLLAVAADSESTAAQLQAAGALEQDMRPRNKTLGRAMGRGDFCDVVRLLAARADPNTRLRQGEGIRETRSGTLLHACCALHNQEGVDFLTELLLHLNADTSAPDHEGDSPLAHARYFGANKIYEILQQHGARVSGPYYRGTLRRIFPVDLIASAWLQ